MTDTPRGAAFGRRALLQFAAAGALALPFVTLSPGSRANAAAACNALMHEDQFASPTTNTWTASIYDGTSQSVPAGSSWSDAALFNPERYALVPDPAGTGETVMRFTVPANQTAYRAEVARRQFTYGRYRQTVSVFIPTDYVPYRFGTIVTQWHGYTLPDGRATNPPLALVVVGAPTPTWQMHMYHLNPDLSTTLDRRILPVPVELGVWHEWTFDITWSTPTTPGLTVVIHNGVEVLRVVGDNNYHQQWPPYYQTGIYRSSWRTGGYPPQSDLQIYEKNITIRELTACTTTPTAQPDVATGDGSAAIALAPFANDTNTGPDTTVDPASLRLVDAAGQPVTRLDVPNEGTWSVDPATSQVAFVAAAGFAGSTSPIRYQAGFVDSDARTQLFGAEMRVDVTRPAVATAPDTASSSGPGAVLLEPLANDEMGMLRSDTVRLVDPATSRPVPAVTVDGVGVFEARPDGTILFTPAAGFEGTASIAYLVDDTFGRTVGNDVRVTIVDNPVAVPPTPTPTASPTQPPPANTPTNAPAPSAATAATLPRTGAGAVGTAVGLGAAALAVGAVLRRDPERTDSA